MRFASALITLREGLEAALVVGIVLGVLRKMGQEERSRSVWAGVLAAVAVSVIAALALNEAHFWGPLRDDVAFSIAT